MVVKHQESCCVWERLHMLTIIFIEFQLLCQLFCQSDQSLWKQMPSWKKKEKKKGGGGGGGDILLG